jgi:hypothetical protein
MLPESSGSVLLASISVDCQQHTQVFFLILQRVRRHITAHCTAVARLMTMTTAQVPSVPVTSWQGVERWLGTV